MLHLNDRKTNIGFFIDVSGLWAFQNRNRPQAIQKIGGENLMGRNGIDF